MIPQCENKKPNQPKLDGAPKLDTRQLKEYVAFADKLVKSNNLRVYPDSKMSTTYSNVNLCLHCFVRSLFSHNPGALDHDSQSHKVDHSTKR